MMREDVAGITVHLKNGADLEFFDGDITVSESVTEIAEKGAPPGRGEPVRYMTIIVHMQPNPLVGNTLAKVQRGGV
jgi:hypothetical protein